MNDKSNGASLSRAKKFWFSIVALLIPIFFILFLELFLRVIGYGHNQDLVIEYAPDTRYYTMNPLASRNYFSDERIATKGLSEVFEKQKSKNTIRIFVLGESTTIGFPYGQNGSFHTWLKYRLMHSYPDKNFEVINFGLTAVNSYTVLGFAKEVIDYKPDAVLVYVGHNEYVGSLGVGSTSNFGSSRPLIQAQIAFRRLRLVQLISRIVGMVSSKSTPTKDTNTGGSLMKTMVANQSIDINSKEYKIGVEQYQANLDALCSFFSTQKIPTFVSNLVSNESDLLPLDAIISDGRSEAVKLFSKAQKSYNDSDFIKAKELFKKALDYDKLRFRAPSEFNQIIRKTISKYKGVYFVDSYSLFEQNSPHKILGKELLLEHVHPNLKGYALISDAFFRSMENANILVDKQNDNMSFDELLVRMPVVKIDSLKGAFVVQFMKSEWPFNQPDTFKLKPSASFEEKMAWKVAYKEGDQILLYDSISDYYLRKGQIDVLAKLLESCYLNPPFDEAIPISIAKCYFTLGNDSIAGFYLKKAFDLSPTIEIAKKGVNTYLDIDQPEKSLPFLAFLVDQKVLDVRLLNGVQSLVGLKSQLVLNTTDSRIRNQIGILYLSLGKEKVAMKYGVSEFPKN